jgi:non-hemolytic enterotoxin B/C
MNPITDKTMAPAQSSISQGMTVQAYCNSVLSQPKVDFTGFSGLLSYQTDINNGLTTAQTHANTYLTSIQPAIITNLSNISNYYALLGALPIALPAGTTEAVWLANLQAVQTQISTYQTSCSGIVTSLTNLNSNLGTDTASFNSTVTRLNSAVNGDNGVLATINDNIDSIDKSIAGCIAGTALSGLAIAGGVFMIAVGGITDFITAGASTPLVVGGVAVLAAGIGGEVASAVTLKNLYAEKSDLLQQKSTLTAEVNLASGICSGYKQLATQATSAMLAVTQMNNAWQSLGSDIGNMSQDLQKGIVSPDVLRGLFLAASNNLIPTINTDITIIKNQMEGIKQLNSGSVKLGDYVQSIASAA